jgi:hypothetical protein
MLTGDVLIVAQQFAAIAELGTLARQRFGRSLLARAVRRVLALRPTLARRRLRRPE